MYLLHIYDYSAITLLIMVTIVGSVMIYSGTLPNQIDGITQQQAETEYCKLVNTLKYPDSSTTTIDRLCYLEQIGKELAAN